jgi:hypothetical protein
MALGGVLWALGDAVQQRVCSALQSLPLLHYWPPLSSLRFLSQHRRTTYGAIYGQYVVLSGGSGYDCALFPGRNDLWEGGESS